MLIHDSLTREKGAVREYWLTDRHSRESAIETDDANYGTSMNSIHRIELTNRSDIGKCCDREDEGWTKNFRISLDPMPVVLTFTRAGLIAAIMGHTPASQRDQNIMCW